MIRHLNTFLILGIIGGCTSGQREIDVNQTSDLLAPDLYAQGANTPKGLTIRYGRYSVAKAEPKTDQRDLMTQIIDINIPTGMRPKVGDALHYVLERSGYSLCLEKEGQAQSLYAQPLPASHYRLGPLTLRGALQVIAGPAWQLEVDELNRGVCFIPCADFRQISSAA